MRLPSHHGRIRTDVAMTPMIDVVFLLLIFFICTASFQMEEVLLPMGLASAAGTEAAATAVNQPDARRIVVRAARAEGRTLWTVNDRPSTTLDEVQEILRAAAMADTSTPITLDVAGTVPLGDMIDLYDLCRVVGLQKIEFAVEAE